MKIKCLIDIFFTVMLYAIFLLTTPSEDLEQRRLVEEAKESAYINYLKGLISKHRHYIDNLLALYLAGQLDQYKGKYVLFSKDGVQHDRCFNSITEAFKYQDATGCSGFPINVGPVEPTFHCFAVITSE